MSRNAVVYESRNRLTGTLMRMIDLKHAGAAKEMEGFPKASKADATKRYVAVCVEHKTVARFDEHYPAGRAIAHPDEWCSKCQTMIKDGKPKIKAPAAAGTTPVAKAPAKTAKAKTPGKAKTSSGARTSDKRENLARNRAHDEQTKPGPVIVVEAQPEEPSSEPTPEFANVD